MGRICVRHCKNFTMLFNFPNKETDQLRRATWLELFNIRDGKNLFACSNHFSDNMFSNRYLKKNAVPDKNLECNLCGPPSKKLCMPSNNNLTHIYNGNCNCNKYLAYIKELEIRIKLLELEKNDLLQQNSDLKSKTNSDFPKTFKICIENCLSNVLKVVMQI